MIYKNISQLTILRKNNKLSQSELAKKMNVSQVTISMWESGTSYPSVPTIHKLSKILNVTAEELFKSLPINEKELSV